MSRSRADRHPESEPSGDDNWHSRGLADVYEDLRTSEDGLDGEAETGPELEDEDNLPDP
ncbi:hypothetical protein ACYJ1Y_14595 [Natrialbaceae archaeon A-gly3]